MNETYRLIEIINRERKRQGMSYRDLAEAVGYKREQMNQVAIVLGHKVTPRIDTLLKLMKPLGLTLAVILKGEEDE
jgi:transcriptional regulator with XRE-family HTH domain